MNSSVWAIAALMTLAISGVLLRAQQPRRLCSATFGFKKRIVSNLGLVEFRVPRSARITTSRDVDYVVYSIRYGAGAEKVYLTMMFGPLVGGGSPHELENKSITWAARPWSCPGIGGADWKGMTADGRHWRHIAIPLGGYAAYQGIPTKAAEYFDKILDTMCCGKCETCDR